MEKTGNIESGTLEHFNNYKYAPTRSTPIDVFAITTAAFASLGNGGGIGGATINNNNDNNIHVAKGINRLNNNHRVINSAESEITSVASLSNLSGHTSQETFAINGGRDWMPKAEA